MRPLPLCVASFPTPRTKAGSWGQSPASTHLPPPLSPRPHPSCAGSPVLTVLTWGSSGFWALLHPQVLRAAGGTLSLEEWSGPAPAQAPAQGPLACGSCCLPGRSEEAAHHRHSPPAPLPTPWPSCTALPTWQATRAWGLPDTPVTKGGDPSPNSSRAGPRLGSWQTPPMGPDSSGQSARAASSSAGSQAGRPSQYRCSLAPARLGLRQSSCYPRLPPRVLQGAGLMLVPL